MTCRDSIVISGGASFHWPGQPRHGPDTARTLPGQLKTGPGQPGHSFSNSSSIRANAASKQGGSVRLVSPPLSTFALPMSSQHELIAVIFDFDDTLMPDSTTALLASRGIDVDHFWSIEAKQLVERGFDPTLAYLQLILDGIGQGKRLGKLTRRDLGNFGRSLDTEYYEGLPRLFPDLRKDVSKFPGIEVEFYIISGGILDVIKGSKIVEKHFNGVYACELDEDPETKLLRRIKRCVTFTEKTRYLFEINKGLAPTQTATNPYLVNKDVPELSRRIPFRNMIYVGDGLTDVPCFSLIKKCGGTPFGVFHPSKGHSAKRAFLEFLKTDRVVSCHAPKYRRADELGSLLRAAVLARCSQIDVERQAAVLTAK